MEFNTHIYDEMELFSIIMADDGNEYIKLISGWALYQFTIKCEEIKGGDIVKRRGRGRPRKEKRKWTRRIIEMSEEN